MDLEDFDLDFLAQINPRDSKESQPASSGPQPKLSEPDPSVEESPDLSFLLFRPDSSEKSAPQRSPLTEVRDEVTVIDPKELIKDLGVLQPVDLEPMDKAQKWSLESASESIEQIERNWQDRQDETKPDKLSHVTEVTEEQLRFSPVPEDINAPLILEGEDRLFGEDDDDDEETAAAEPRIVGPDELDFSLEDTQDQEVISVAENDVPRVQQESPFVESDEPLVLPQGPDAMEEYQALLAKQDDVATQVEHETFELDLSALPGVGEDEVSKDTPDTKPGPIIVNDPISDNPLSDLPNIPVEEPLVLRGGKDDNAQLRKPATSSDHPKTANSPKVSEAPESRSGRAAESAFSLSSLFANSPLIGLDIGSSSTKYAVVKKTARGFKLVNCGMRALPAGAAKGNEEEYASNLADILSKEFKIKSYNNALVSSAVSGLEVVYKNVQVPKMTPKELTKAVPWACRKDLPFPIESTVFEYDVIQKKAGKSDAKLDIFIVAAQKELVLSHVNLLRKAQIVPDKVSTVASALWNLFQLMDKKYSDGCYAVVDIGAKSSHIIFVNNGQLQFAREIAKGGDDITDGLTGSIFVDGEEITISREKAEGLKRKYGYLSKINVESQDDVLPLKEIAVMMGPVLEKLAKEIQRTIDFYKERFAIESLERIFITGGTALLKNLPAYLSTELNTEVDILNPFEFISVKKFSNQEDLMAWGPRMAVPLGLAIDKRKQLNLLPKEIRGARTSRHVKKMIPYLTVAFILAMVFLSQNVKRQIGKIESEFSRRKIEYEVDRPKREKFLALQKRMAVLKSTQDSYRQAMDFSLNKADHMKAISNLIPRNITLISFAVTHRETKNAADENKVSIDEILILTGVALNKDSMEGINLAQFLLDLEKSNYFYDIELKTQKIREDGNLEFLLECVI